jgi:ADP-ribosyl-[dinitrogen reductase] hydrolase
MFSIDQLYGGIYGVAVGDALGVPVEFSSREKLQAQPVTSMMGYMSWNQPPGTWSDDSSLTFCTMESLSKDLDIEDMALTMTKWYQHGHWGAHHKLFDIGGSTKHSLQRVVDGLSARVSGNIYAEDNGNGSLMRILPLVYFLYGKEDIAKRYEIIRAVSSITHAHFRSVFSCFIHITYADLLLKGIDKSEAYTQLKSLVTEYVKIKNFNPLEVGLFDRVLKNDINLYPENTIQSGGYVLHSLEASLWCLLNTHSYEQAVLKAVNLGGDTDTTAAITGGLAGIYYGFDTIPQQWKAELARYDDIMGLCKEFFKSIQHE